MKPKVHYQVQPRQVVPPEAQVQQDIQNFLRALDSYPARAAKQPRVTFLQHMCSVSAARNDDDNSNDNARRDPRHLRQ
jgi:hypothetical protein